METTNYIEFKKERDLGAIISDTFKFIRHNWKTYFLTLIKISYPALLFFLASLILYLYFIGDIYSGIGNIEDNSEYFGSNLIVLIIAVIFMLISLVVLYALIQGSTLNYMKSYVNNFGVTEYNEIRRGVRNQFWRFIGLFFLLFLVFIIAGFLAVFPGAAMQSIGFILFSYLLLIAFFIYLWPYINLIPAVISFKDFNLSKAIGYGFRLVEGQWFSTFGVFFVVGFILSFLGFIFYIPAMIYQMVKMMTVFSENNPSEMFQMYRDPIYILLTLLSYVGQFMVFSLIVIATSFIYYDLNEQKNLTGTLEKIESIGE